MTLSDNARGILLMCGSMLAFTVNDSFMKAATKTVPLFQAITLRGLVATVALLIIARATTGGFDLIPAGRDRRVIALRSLTEVAATALFLMNSRRVIDMVRSPRRRSQGMVRSDASWAGSSWW